MLRRFPLNTYGRDFVVGDIHGCFSIQLFEIQFIALRFSTVLPCGGNLVACRDQAWPADPQAG